MKRIIGLTLLLGLLAACASTGSAPSTAPATTGAGADADGILTIASGTAVGPGISIEEAIGNSGGDPLLVNGALFVDLDGRVLLCDAMAESFPPQCGGTRLEVHGLDFAAVPEMQEANGVRWVEQVQLLGSVTLIEL